jgi:hypothetical protein
MPDSRSRFEKLASRLGASVGFFVARYRPGYVYVRESQLRNSKLVPKKPRVEPPKTTFNTLDEDRFYVLASRVIADGRTYLAQDRLYVLWQAVRNVHSLCLPVAEVGSYRGGSAFFLAKAFQVLAGEEMPVHIFDTFEGLPDKTSPESDGYYHHMPGKFVDADYESVKAYLSEFRKLEIHKGEFSERAKTLPEMRFSLVHSDVDIYQSTLDCLQYFGPRLASGGMIIVDDYGAPTCPGVNQAVTEYLRSTNEFYAWHPLSEQLVLLKR